MQVPKHAAVMESLQLLTRACADSLLGCLQGDLAAGDMIHGVEGVDPQRRQQLIDLLDIDLQWRLNRVSDGQRRRVQICMGLLKPYQVYPGCLYRQRLLL